MNQKTPPLQAIQAFLTAVHAPSFRVAADVLALSPSALSRRIATLERYLGVRLYDRTGARPRLTAAGSAYSQRIAPALDLIRRASLELRECTEGGPLRLQVSQSLAMNWLMPQLPILNAECREVNLALTIGRELGPIYTGACEVGVFAVPRELHGLPAETLLSLDTAVISAPVMVDGPPPTTASEIAGHTLLAPSDPPSVWSRWLPEPAATSPQLYDTIAMSYEATAAGLGLGLGMQLHVDRYLRDDRLRFCLPESRPSGYAYALVYASEAVQRRADVRRVCDWLHAAAARSRLAFESALGATSLASV